MKDRDYDYDEDVFSLEEDLTREKRKQWIQYIVVAAFAVAVIALALYGSIVLTNRRVEEAKTAAPVTEVQSPEGETEEPAQTAQPVNTDFWPETLFPSVPVLESAAYNTKTGANYADVEVPSATANHFDSYIQQLVDAGAATYVRTSRLSVLMFDGVEIHLVNSNQDKRVTLAKEDACTFADGSYSAFPLPETGRLVSVKDGVSPLGRVLTYRGATTLDALQYAGSLAADGWTLSGSLEPSNNIFSAVYKKNNLEITVDYFASSDNYLVKLDFQS